MEQEKLNIYGKIARFFQTSNLTPLLVIITFLMGIFAIFVTPREEEPQIDVTMANIFIPFPGANVKNVEQMVSIPAEQVLSQIMGIEHITSASMPSLSVITVQFKVGIKRDKALLDLHTTVASNFDWLPRNLGVMQPIIKSKGIDDVPIVTLTLFNKLNTSSAFDIKESHYLEKIANLIETDLKRIKGVKEVLTIGGAGSAIKVSLDLEKLDNHGLTIPEIKEILMSANHELPIGDLLINEHAITMESGKFFKNIEDVSELIIGVRDGLPIFLKDVANITKGPKQLQRMVSHMELDPKSHQSIEYPAITMAITKNNGENAIRIAKEIKNSIKYLKPKVIPEEIEVLITRNYGETADEKATTLMHKLIFATISVILLVALAVGRREGMIVGGAVIITLLLTLFASWAIGFTINRVSLFALIFSIGILVDDAIVVVDNVHRHKTLNPNQDLTEIIPVAIDEIGNPTVLATFTVIAALFPMKFVSGLMGPYMSPIPVIASLGMLLSLIVAFIITPWMSKLLLKSNGPTVSSRLNLLVFFSIIFNKIFELLLNNNRSAKINRIVFLSTILIAIIIALALPITGLVKLKMLPFDNKSEFQIILNMPLGTRLEETAKVLRKIGEELTKSQELLNYQMYVGTAAPVNFNGLVRQYYLRQSTNLGDLQVNLISKKYRHKQSHFIATKLRPLIKQVADQYQGIIKVVEIPPGPPVFSPIVAEIYGNNTNDRFKITKAIRKILESISGVVDVDDSTTVKKNLKTILIIDRYKSNLMGISQKTIINTLRSGLAGEDVVFLHDESRYPTSVTIRLPENCQNSIGKLLNLSVKNNQKEPVKLYNFIKIEETEYEDIIYHKDLLPVNYVIADTAGTIDSPLYGLFKASKTIKNLPNIQKYNLKEHFITQPTDPYNKNYIKWDGEWKITYETFRDLSIDFLIGLILIYILLVAEFHSYIIPLIIMLPIPLTIIGVMPGHALLNTQFTATSMIGMIALSGIIIRNSILLIDFAKRKTNEGVDMKRAIIDSTIHRAKPIILTGLAAILGGFFILNDPIFNGLAISLIFGILVSTLLTLLVIPLLYFLILNKTNLTN